ncbi:hypothetical protein [Roseateles sp. YR242]|uniref:hypothetical protein n=1 Tax=Roseateles sp. YR242 TaxID=1855305 RepID=UPI0011608B9B|nr:hypothetical protein [Roseateles sp. YR242]
MNSQQFKVLEISNGVRVGCSESGKWLVEAKNGVFPLQETTDFWRVVVLLERKYSDVKSMFEEFAHECAPSSPFPYWRLVGAGLGFKTEQWASLALNWVPELQPEELLLIKPALEDVASSKWASQKSRQLADKFAKRAIPVA